MNTPQLLIIDAGSQYTKVISRELLALGYKNLIISPEEVQDYLNNHNPKGIIISGGAASVYDVDAPKIPEAAFLGCPVLGICYGMQLIVHNVDQKFVVGSNSRAKEYGPTEVVLSENDLFRDVPSPLKAWASHGDSVLEHPDYKVIARSSDAIQAIQLKYAPVFGVQFHPEVLDTEDENKILENFAHIICGCEKDWVVEDAISSIRKSVLDSVGTDTVGIGVSGGVDSMTLAGLLAFNLQDALIPFLIDIGALRHEEREEIVRTCKSVGIPLVVIDAQDEFFHALQNVVDAEEKRRIFKETYQAVFKKVIQDRGIKHILQGTLATDLIESGSAGSAQLIKSHHNVGLDFGVNEITPFKHLFKHEVRDIARRVVGNSVSKRQPFPGPGLFVRVVGVPITKELISMVRKADYIVNTILAEESDEYFDSISQTVVALLGTRVVGVQGDKRTYEYPLVVRVVHTTDFMTAQGMELPSRVREKIITELTKIGCNRVFFDETPKPPATVEFE